MLALRTVRTTRALRAPLIASRRLMSSLPPHTVVGLPALSPTMTQGNIAGYLVKEGDAVSAGDRLAEIETDKATVDFEMVDDGIVAKILLPAGSQDVAIGTPMVILVEEASDVAAFADYVAEAAPAAAAAPEPAPAPAAAAPAAAPPPPPPPAAAAPAIDLSAAAMPMTGGKIYFNEARGWFRA